jgi:hypothetical protein
MFTPKALDPKSHFWRHGGLAVDDVGQRRAAHAEGLGGLADGKAKLTENFLSDEDAGVGRPHSYSGERLGHQ